MRFRAIVAGAAMLAAALMALDVNPATPQTASLAALRSPEDPGLDPGNRAWDHAQEITLPLSAQQVTYPFGGGSTAEVRVRALYHQRDLYLRVTWNDSSRDDATNEVGQFTDAVAVEFPVDPKSSVPSLCMGQADGGVNIWQWRADHDVPHGRWPQGVFSHGYVDLYPSRSDLFFPARRVGNPIARRSLAAQDLVAQGFGTLGKAPTQRVRAHGAYSPGNESESATWTVVFKRPFAKPGAGQPGFAVRDEFDVAFAVWNGQEGERNGMKSVSAFGRLVLSSASQPAPPWSGWWFVALPVMVLAFLGIWRFSRWLGGATSKVQTR